MRARIWIGIGVPAVMLVAAAVWLHTHTTRYDDIIREASARYRIDFDLVKALIYEESWFRAGSRGTAGELGLMQVTMGAAADYSSRSGLPPITENQLLEPELNVEVGCWYLRNSLDRYRNSPAPTMFALLRYNAGEIHADRWLRAVTAQPDASGMSGEEYFLSFVDFPATRDYVRRILQRSRRRTYWI